MQTFKDLYTYLIDAKYGQNECQLYNQHSADSFGAISYDNFLEEVAGYIKLLHSFNLQHGDRICIMGQTSTRWLAADFAIMCLGLVCVPLFLNSSGANLKFEIEQSAPSLFIAENYFCKQSASCHGIDPEKIIYFNDVRPVKPSTITDILNKTAVHSTMLASIVYTSGTTGLPNGVMLSHYNLISQVLNSAKVFSVGPEDVAISFLPTAHIFQRMICYLYIYRLVNVYFVNDYATLVENFKTIRPTLLTTVPRVLEKAYSKILLSLNSKTGLAKIIASLAKKHAQRHDPNKKSFINKLYNKPVFYKILAIFGGRIRMVISGGAKLNDEVYRFFVNVGLPLYQGYGMTETSPVIASNNPSEYKCYSVGKFFDEISYKILEDGELCVKGPNLMLGYYKQNDGDEKHFVDGYFRTGDIVKIDEAGFVYVISRKKELFKTSNGKYVNPNKIEFLLLQNQVIENCCVIADGKKFVSAVIFTKNGNKDSNKAEIEKIIMQINQKLDPHEQIVKFFISNDFISPEAGELTPSLKLRRFVIYEKYKKQIDNFYEELH